MSSPPEPGPGHKLVVRVPASACDAFEDALTPLATAVLAVKDDDTPLEDDDPPDTLWRLSAYLPDAASLAAARDAVSAAAAAHGLDPAPPAAIEAVPDEDWAARSQASFQPRRAARFYLHPGHIEPPPGEAWPLRIDAGAAFGSGEHATTAGCLTALDALATDGVSPASVLDMGTGSGILAVAAAMLWDAPVLAVDNDPVAVATAAGTADANGQTSRITTLTSEGYAAPEIAAAGPFDIITANILAGPLAAMAPELAAHIAPGGFAILSGLLTDQADAVLGPHEAAGLTLVRRFPGAEWVTLLLTRPR